jgi:hypothetical protein
VRPPRRRFAALAWRYGGACLAVAVAALAWTALSEYLRLPIILLYPTVMLVALLGARSDGPGRGSEFCVRVPLAPAQRRRATRLGAVRARRQREISRALAGER